MDDEFGDFFAPPVPESLFANASSNAFFDMPSASFTSANSPIHSENHSPGNGTATGDLKSEAMLLGDFDPPPTTPLFNSFSQNGPADDFKNGHGNFAVDDFFGSVDASSTLTFPDSLPISPELNQTQIELIQMEMEDVNMSTVHAKENPNDVQMPSAASLFSAQPPLNRAPESEVEIISTHRIHVQSDETAVNTAPSLPEIAAFPILAAMSDVSMLFSMSASSPASDPFATLSDPVAHLPMESAPSQSPPSLNPIPTATTTYAPVISREPEESNIQLQLLPSLPPKEPSTETEPIVPQPLPRYPLQTSTQNLTASTTTNAEFPHLRHLTPFFGPAALLHDLPPRDPLGDLLSKHFPTIQIIPVSRRGNTQKVLELLGGDVDSPTALDTLVRENQWRLVVVVTKRIIFAFTEERLKTMREIAELMRIWFTRCLALFHLKFYEILEVELSKLPVEQDILHGRHYPYLSHKDESLVSFQLRVMKARSPALRNDIVGSINKLYSLLILAKQHTEGVWRRRENDLQLLIAGHLVEMKDYHNARKILTKLGVATELLYLLDLHSGFIHPPPLTANATQDCLFQMASHQLNSPTASLPQPQSQSSILNLANLATQYLYNGQAQFAIQILQTTLTSHPTQILVGNTKAGEVLVSNLCAAVELMPHGDVRKREVLEFICKHVGEGWDASLIKV